MLQAEFSMVGAGVSAGTLLGAVVQGMAQIVARATDVRPDSFGRMEKATVVIVVPA